MCALSRLSVSVMIIDSPATCCSRSPADHIEPVVHESANAPRRHDSCEGKLRCATVDYLHHRRPKEALLLSRRSPFERQPSLHATKRKNLASPILLVRFPFTWELQLVPRGLTRSESARSRCCRSFGLAQCGLQAASRGVACPASTHFRAVHPRGGHQRDTGQPVCVKVRYRVWRAHGCATGPAEPAPPPEHTRHFKPTIRAL